LAFYVIVNSQTAEAQSAPHAASEGKTGVIPVQIIDRDAKPLSSQFNRQQFVRALPGSWSAQPRHCSAADFLQFTEQTRKFTCRELLGDQQDGLKLIPHVYRPFLSFRVETSVPLAP
jgi:hypothetical protein